MGERKIYSCPNCGRKIYFEGLCFNCKTEVARESYLSLSVEQVEQKIQDIINNIKDEKYDDEEFLKLFCYHTINTSRIAEVAFEKSIFHTKELYFNASTKIRDKMINRLKETDNESEANHLLSCLAMQGDDEVLKAFVELENHPKPWRKKLHVNPSIYAQSGGWSFDKVGNRVELTYPQCYRMIKGDKSKDNAIIVGKINKKKCPHCGSHMVDILTIDGRDKRLGFLRIDGIIKITICISCSPYSFCQYTINGESEIISSDSFDGECIDDEVLQALENNTYILAKEPVLPFYGCCDDDLITIGGMGNWVDDCIHDSCPKCGKTMKYFAQIQGNSLEEWYEGTFYFEICHNCQIISISYQQT